MNEDQSPLDHTRRAELIALAGELRPQLHRYCARLMGSVIEGEDVVQDTLAKVLVTPDGPSDVPSRRAWLFRIAHNRALDLLRGKAIRAAEPIEAAQHVADEANLNPAEALMRQEAVKTAVSRFAQLPILQRSVLILKDILDESLADIALLLNLSVDSVKAHLARGRARLRKINAKALQLPEVKPASAEVARYVALFNQRDWESLRALLADDVKLNQSAHPVRVGSADVGMFFSLYAKMDSVWLAPAWLEGREVVAVFENRSDAEPSYFMWLAWRNNKIAFIRDYKYVRYVVSEAELLFPPGSIRAARESQ